MSDDDLEHLRRAMQAATPRPDPARRAATLRAAEENFDRRQGSGAGLRPSSNADPITGWLWTGVKQMIQTLSTRGGLVATTALVAVGLVVFIPTGRNLMNPPEVLSEPRLVDELGNVTGSSATSDTTSPTLQRDALAPVTPPAPPVAKAEREEAPAEMFESMPEMGMAEDADMTAAGQSFATSVASAPMPTPAPAQESRSRRVVEGMIAPPSDSVIPTESDTEAYANEAPSDVKVVSTDPVSTFSVDVDTASYAVVRSSLTRGYLPPEGSVRVEEMINYFPYDYAAPEAGEAPFRPTVSVMDTPWNEGTQLVRVALQGRMPAIADRPPLNLVFLIDTSGSMQDANKLPLLKQSFRLMLSELRPEDQVAIVTYAGSAGQVLEATPAAERSKILGALDQLQAGGSTAGQAGLQQAYAVAADMSDEGEVTRVILATDGDFNVGISDPNALKDFIADKREDGTYLSVLGFGRGNLDDATMQALAQNGNGQAAYIDTLTEAQKVLVDQLSGALFPIANDVKIQVEWNPATVAEYRLIGYETRALRREDFNNDRVDAGEIGAGHAVTAIYEVTPVGSPAVLNTPLRYGEAETPEGSTDELGFLRLRYKEPGETVSTLIETPIPVSASEAGTEARFAAAIAGFGQLLRGGDYLGDWGYDDAIALANGAKGADPYGYRAEAVTLMRLADSLSAR
ncbi:MAG: VWA domain-containing protein [Rhodobacteraceae bacterium]|nr:VWA domain-containing protein [Paracoccaceae bacterium]